MMVDFKKILKEARTNQEKLKEQQQAVRETEKVLNEALKTLIEACRPSCLEAIDIYNLGRSLEIVSHSIKFSFSDEEEPRLSLSVRLEYSSSGSEPDEEFGGDEILQTQSEFGAILNQTLKLSNIPFTLGKLSVPSDYYTK
jgi:hypothetical protein